MSVSVVERGPFRGPRPLSFSQLSSYTECGERYRLERVERIRPSTWWSTLMGSAVHQVTEDLDIQHSIDPKHSPTESEIREAFLAELEERVQKERGEILASGKQVKELSESSGGPNKKDRAWVETFGPIFVQRWVAWRENNGLKLTTMPDGTPATEVPFELEFVNRDGEVLEVRGYIDRVYERALGSKTKTVVDLKTGKIPESALQLATYGVGLEACYGMKAGEGFFWSPLLGATGRGKTWEPSPIGGTSLARDLSLWDAERLGELYFAAKRGIENEVFLPTITNLCRGCVVREYCWGYSGSKAKTKEDFVAEQIEKSNRKKGEHGGDSGSSE